MLSVSTTEIYSNDLENFIKIASEKLTSILLKMIFRMQLLSFKFIHNAAKIISSNSLNKRSHSSIFHSWETFENYRLDLINSVMIIVNAFIYVSTFCNALLSN